MSRCPLALLLCACSSELAAQAPYDQAVITNEEFRDVSLRVDIIPSRLRESNDEDAPFRAMPETVSLPPIQEDSSYDIGDIELADPVVQSGSVTAFRVNPSVAVLPGETIPVEGSVRIRLPDTVQSYTARSDMLGEFSAWAVPGRGYRLEIVPDDPLLPMYTDWLSAILPEGVTDPAAPVELSLEAGVPIYGRVSSAAAAGLADAKIHVVDPFGARSSTALSDAFGLYQIRVSPGIWTVVCEGRDNNGKDPTLRFADLVVGDTGLNLDIAYPTDLAPAYVEGVIEDLDGIPLDGATIRLVADALDGYGALDASWSTEVTVNKTGFVSRIVPGRYTIEALPPEDSDDLSPLRLSETVQIGPGTTDLDPIQLGPRVSVAGSVEGPGGVALESARITCREIGFDGRRFREVFTGPQGNFSIELPTVPVLCEAEPPGSHADLATSRAILEPSQDEEHWLDFSLSLGHRITGRVLSDGVPEPSVAVQIQDEEQRILGIGLTLEDGVFSIPVDLRRIE